MAETEYDCEPEHDCDKIAAASHSDLQNIEESEMRRAGDRGY